MNTSALAKELDGLARRLRALSSEAATEFASALQLEQRRGATDKPLNRFAAPALTVAMIAGALEQQTRKGSVRVVELRSDVFDRRVERQASAFARRFERECIAGAAAPAGHPVAVGFLGRSEGVKWWGDCTPGFADRTPITADFHSWLRAFRYVLATLVPDYSRNVIERRARERAPDGPARWNLEERMSGALDQWIERNTFLRCALNAEGKVVAIAGADPAPWVEMLAKFRAGNPDPLGILASGTPNA